MHVKDPSNPTYQYLINKREEVGVKLFKNPVAFTEYSKDIKYVYKSIEDYSPGKSVLIEFDDMIADLISNKKHHPLLTELFIRGRKLNVFNTKHYTLLHHEDYEQPRASTYCHHLFNINFDGSSINVLQRNINNFDIGTILSLDNPLSFQKNLLEGVCRVIMTIDDKIRDENLQCDISSAAAKISTLSSGKIDKYGYLAGDEILSTQ